jgi:NADH:ubiquinone oxidoreductase subunit 2 (subunit N)
MITFAIIIIIVAKALPVLNTYISDKHVTRITSIVFLFAGALTLNTLNLESLSSGLGIYSGFFQVTTISQLIEIFLFLIGGGILIAWPLNKLNLTVPTALAPSLDAPANNIDSIKNKKIKKRGGAILGASAIGGSSTLSRLVALFQVKQERGSSPLAFDPLRRGLEQRLVCKAEGSGVNLIITDKQSPLCAAAAAAAAAPSPLWRQALARDGGTDYSLVVLFSSLGSSLLISSYDLISIYLSIELQSFGLYVLSTLYREKESSTSAGLKYFLLGGLSSCIILLGTGIIYSYTGTTNLESLYIINSVTGVSRLYIIQGISLGLSLIFIGFLFKIAAAPLHNWSPDVYDGTPTIVTTWLTIIPKIAILFILLELQVKLGSFGPLGESFKTIVINNSGNLLNLNQGGANILKTLLLISATLSLIIGSLLGLAQIRIKRLLAYSTISHIGFILLALAVNTEQSIDSFIFYIIQYTITNLNIFLVILGLTYCLNTITPPAFLSPSPFYSYFNNKNKKKERRGKSSTSPKEDSPSPCPLGTLQHPLLRERVLLLRRGRAVEWNGGVNKDISLISEFKGLFFSNPLLSISLAVSLFSMAGIPPLIGFFSKQLVLYSALQNGYYFISVLAIIVSVISCSYYLQIIKILFTPSSAENGPTPAKKQEKISCLRSSSIPLAALPEQNLRLDPSPRREAPPLALFDIYSSPPLSPLQGYEQRLGSYTDKSLEGEAEINLTNTHSYLISTLTFTILFFFIKPSLILNSTQLLSLSLFYI